jgi:hypothetical protein
VVHRFVHSPPSCVHPLHVVVDEQVTRIPSAITRGNARPQGAWVCSPVFLSMTTSWKKSWSSLETKVGV